MLGRARDDRRGVLDLEHDLVRPAFARQPASRPHLRDDQLATAGQSELRAMPSPICTCSTKPNTLAYQATAARTSATVSTGTTRACGAERLVSMVASVNDRSR